MRSQAFVLGILWLATAGCGQSGAKEVGVESQAKAPPDGGLQLVDEGRVELVKIGDAFRFRFDLVCASPDGRHYAHIAREASGSAVVRDGRKGAVYEAVGRPVFSADGEHMAYPAIRRGRAMIVLDDREGRPYDDIAARSLAFSPQGAKVAFVAWKEQKQLVVAQSPEGTDEGRLYDAISGHSLEFSPNGRRLAYVAVRNDKQILVVDGVEDAEHWAVLEQRTRFSPDSRRVAYVALPDSQDDGAILMVDGVARTKRERIGSRVRYPTPKDSARPSVADGVVFSPDASRWAYVVQREGRWVAAVGDERTTREGKPYDRIADLQFLGDGRLAYSALSGADQCVVIDGEEGRKHSGDIVRPVFSPDGKSLAYVVRSDDRKSVMVDGREYGPYDEIGGGNQVFRSNGERQDTPSVTLRFSPDGRRLAYAIKRGKEWRAVVIEGGAATEGAAYDGVIGLDFSPDGRHIAYLGFRGRSPNRLVVDGAEWGDVDFFLGRIAFQGNDAVEIVGLKGASIARQRIGLSAKPLLAQAAPRSSAAQGRETSGPAKDAPIPAPKPDHEEAERARQALLEALAKVEASPKYGQMIAERQAKWLSPLVDVVRRVPPGKVPADLAHRDAAWVRAWYKKQSRADPKLLVDKKFFALVIDGDVTAEHLPTFDAIQRELVRRRTIEALSPADRQIVERHAAVVELIAFPINRELTAGIRLRPIEAEIAEASRKLEQKPDDPAAYVRRGIAYRRAGRAKLAIADFSKAIELDPASATAYRNRAIARASGSIPAAIKDLQEAVRLNPRGPAPVLSPQLKAKWFEITALFHNAGLLDLEAQGILAVVKTDPGVPPPPLNEWTHATIREWLEQLLKNDAEIDAQLREAVAKKREALDLLDNAWRRAASDFPDNADLLLLVLETYQKVAKGLADRAAKK